MMTPKVMSLVALAITASGSAVAQESVQIPGIIRAQALEIQDKFGSVLEEECPSTSCSPVGCEVSRFVTLDTAQTSSLPGLEEETATSPAVKPQYKLTSVVCEFTYEASLDNEALGKLRQRLLQKVKPVGVAVQLRSRQLQPKPDTSPKKPEEAKTPPVEPPAPPPTPPVERSLIDEAFLSIIPALPYIVGGAFAVMGLLALIWALRRLGRDSVRVDPHTLEGDKSVVAIERRDQELPESTPTPRMLMTRIDQMRDELTADQRLVELTLRKSLDEERMDELTRLVRHFGPELLGPLKEKPEYAAVLTKLSEYFDAELLEETPADIWAFLERLDRSMVAAKIRIDGEPLTDHFGFLNAVEVDEFIGLLGELSDQEAVAAVSHAPRRLREQFFAHANPAFTATFVEHLTKVDKFPDYFVREVARKLRQLHQDKGDTLRTSRLDRIPLLEEALNALPAAKRRELIDHLGQSDPNFLRELAPKVFLDDAVPLLPDDVLTEMFLAVSPAEAGDYIAAFSWGDELLKRLNPRLADTIRRHMSQDAGGQLSHMARDKIATFVKKQDDAGVIDLAQINARLIQ